MSATHLLEGFFERFTPGVELHVGGVVEVLVVPFFALLQRPFAPLDHAR